MQLYDGYTVKKYTKKEIRDAASAVIVGMLSRLELKVSGKMKKIAKDAAKLLAREIIDEQKKQLRKLRKRSKSGLN